MTPRESLEFWLADEPDDACTCNICAFSRNQAHRALHWANGDRELAARLFAERMPGRRKRNEPGQ